MGARLSKGDKLQSGHERKSRKSSHQTGFLQDLQDCVRTQGVFLFSVADKKTRRKPEKRTRANEPKAKAKRKSKRKRTAGSMDGPNKEAVTQLSSDLDHGHKTRTDRQTDAQHRTQQLHTGTFPFLSTVQQPVALPKRNSGRQTLKRQD